MKQCTKCGEQKPLEAFAKDRSRRDGLQRRCRECNAVQQKAYREANPDYMKAHREANREHYQARVKAWNEANPDYRKAYQKAYYEANYEANLARKTANVRARKAGLGQATPMWADREAIAAIYAEAARLTEETGIPHHVDHIIPLKGRGVCGLHVPWNLRAIPAAENLSKSNRIPDHLIV